MLTGAATGSARLSPLLLPSVLAAVAALGPAATGGVAGDLDALRWTSRLLVVAAPSADDPGAIEQKRLFATAEAGARDRDLVLVEASGDGPRAAEIRRRFGIPAGAFRAVLVGKDGDPKLASPSPIPAERLFAEIDGMPMRQDEMRRARDGGSRR